MSKSFKGQGQYRTFRIIISSLSSQTAWALAPLLCSAPSVPKMTGKHESDVSRRVEYSHRLLLAASDFAAQCLTIFGENIAGHEWVQNMPDYDSSQKQR